MSETYGLPQPLNGAETITIHQIQNGQIAKCTMPLSVFLAYVTANIPSSSSTSWVSSLPTTEPATAGVLWNNTGVVSIS